MKTLRYTLIILLIILLYGSIQLYRTIPNDYRFKPSGYHVFVPESTDLPFQNYIQVNQTRIKSALKPFFEKNPTPYPAKYTLDYISQQAAPFEISPSNLQKPSLAKGHKTGFIFIHGLGKTARDFRPIATELHKRYPQSLMRGLLLSGHGTVIGDSLHTHRNQWRKSVNYTIASMKDKVDNLYLIGYSAGATLIVDYLQHHPSINNFTIKGLVLIDPGLGAQSITAKFTPWIRRLFPFDDVFDDHAPLTYTSWTHNLSAEYIRLIDEISPLKKNKTPTFMVLSTDDDTIDTDKALEYFCHKSTNPTNKLILFQGTKPAHNRCQGIHVYQVKDYPKRQQQFRFINLSHKASINSPDDPLFGFDKWYRNCNHYNQPSDSFEKCKSDNKATVYGSLSLNNHPEELKGRLFRRIEFNPFYPEMMSLIKDFIDQEQTASS
ncbi:MAG TPA: alpha/beta hydrolase [Gammaproteobacteria bacterium]|nr:alpha/beta hydrolase [Gammaproteobacteria bacterium]